MSSEPTSKNALVVEGGAMRGIFSAGVLDAFLSAQFDPFDLYFGVSAGASNLAAYQAEMYQRNYRIYTTYSREPKFINWKRFLLGGHLIDLDWMWEITIRETRLDLETLFSKNKIFVVVVTSVDTAKAIYLEPNAGNCEDYLKASSSIPIFYRGFLKIHGERVTDGGVADSIPVLEAYRRGARNILVVRSRPYPYVKRHGLGAQLYSLFLKDAPQLKSHIPQRAVDYGKAIEFIRNPPQGVRVVEVNPPQSFPVQRLTRDLGLLNAGYQLGVEQGHAAMRQWSEAMQS